MFNLQAVKLKKAENIGRMQAIYSNAKEVLTPTINSIDFEKAIKEDGIKFHFEEIVKGFIDKSLTSIANEKDEIKKSEIANTVVLNFSSLERINVVFDSLQKSIYVDVIDKSNCYSDNAINRHFERVGQVANNRKKIESVEND